MDGQNKTWVHSVHQFFVFFFWFCKILLSRFSVTIACDNCKACDIQLTKNSTQVLSGFCVKNEHPSP